MASIRGEFKGMAIPLTNGTGADADVYRFVDYDPTDNEFIKPTANGPAVGVLQPDKTAYDYDNEKYVVPKDRAGAVIINGIVAVEAAGAITKGHLVKTDANGKAVTAGAATSLEIGEDVVWILGRAVEAAGAAGDIVLVELVKFAVATVGDTE